MITLSYPLVGIICLLIALAIMFFWPIGSSRRNHLAGEIVIIVLFVAAGGFLYAGGWLPESVSWFAAMGIGLIVGIVAVVLRDVRRYSALSLPDLQYTHPTTGTVARAVFGGAVSDNGEETRRKTGHGSFVVRLLGRSNARVDHWLLFPRRAT
jgi:hypothetical protein